MKPLRLTLAVTSVLALMACADPEAGEAALDGYRDGGLFGAIASTAPEALAERKRKAELRAAFHSKLCERVAPAGTEAHQGCVLQFAEIEKRRADAARWAAAGVMCMRFMDSVICQ